MKATRIAYMKQIKKFLDTKDYPDQDLLEISGDTKEWHKYFSNILLTAYPEVDAHDMPYDDESFDCVVLNQVLEHVRKPWVVIKEVHRVLRTGGIAIVSSPFFYQVHKHPEDLWRFTDDGLAALCEDFSEILLKDRAGNGNLIKHIIDNPDDRSSDRMIEFANLPNDEIYYLIASVVARK